MFSFWKKKNWEDDYDEYYAQDRGIRETKPRTKTRYVAHLLMLTLMGGLVTAGVGLVSGTSMVEKFLTALASPLGAVWMGLLLLVYFSLLNRQAWPAVVGLLCWIVITLGGNQLVANGLAGMLEAPYQQLNPYEGEPYDLVVVLGGGTTTTIGGQSQLHLSGDRVAVAARMFHAGLAKRIVCTGTQTFRSTDLDLHPREEAANILNGLGVPKGVVMQMKGNNTSEEMANLKTWMSENKIEGRVGVITSAWHLSRAIRLAESNGLMLEPLPANFISELYTPNPSVIVPNSSNLMTTTCVCKEYLASWVGR